MNKRILSNLLGKKVIFLVVLFLGDLLAFFISFSLAYQLRIVLEEIWPQLFPFSMFPFAYFWLNTFWIPGFLFLILACEGLYTNHFFYLEEVKKILKSIFLWFFGVFFIAGITKKSGEISRITIILSGLFLLLFLPFFRVVFRSFLINKNIGVKKLFLVGVNETSLNVVKFLNRYSQVLGYKVTGFFDKNQFFKVPPNNFFKIKPLKYLNRSLKSKLADGLLVCLDIFEHEREFLKFLTEVQRLAPEIYFIPKSNKNINVSFLKIESIPLFGSEGIIFKYQNHIHSFFNCFLKNFLDFLITLFFLPVVVVLSLFIAILIKLDSPGPVLFVQERVGKEGRKIKIYKFRTMFVDAEKKIASLVEKSKELSEEWNKKRKLVEDPRITRMGKFLRKFSLDELPQFLNILKGEMSLIGPRPVTEEELNLYYKEFKEIYFQVKPGLTGFWQVMGRNEIDYPTRVLMDTYYVLNWSLWLDLYILVKTPLAVITGKGAY